MSLSSSFVVLIFGASGSGKSSLMSQLLHAGRRYSIHMKGTDRARRKYDDVEIVPSQQVTEDAYDYIYQTYGYRYGIQRAQIDAAIQNNQHHFIICNDIQTIVAIRRDYGARVRVVFHAFDAPRKAILGIQNERGIADDEIGLRIAKIDTLYRAFLQHYKLFDGVLNNQFGEPLKRLREEMEQLLTDFASGANAVGLSHTELAGVVTQIERYINEGKGRPGASDPDYAFIIMAIRDTDDMMEDVCDCIKQTCSQHGVRAERVDEIEFAGEITAKILSSIEMAGFVIADLTHERPNVYYEIGYAHALQKAVLLIARHGTKLHFDVQGRKVRFYKNIRQLAAHLSKAITSLRIPRASALLEKP